MSTGRPGESSERAPADTTVDAIYAGFTQSWTKGSRPRIEEALAEAPADDRAALLRRLLPLDLKFRRSQGEVPQAEDYAARLPAFSDVVTECFQNTPVVDSEKTLSASRAASPDPFATVREGARSDAKTPGQADATQFQDDITIHVPPAESASEEGEFGYEILHEIARGGMGVVLKARQKKLKRIVALKMILSGQLASQQEIQRFYIEAEAAASLDHPNIVPIYEVGERKGQHFFSMGFVDGTNLARWASVNRPLPADSARLLKTVAEAVHYAHCQGIVHRDLKPANILVDRSDQPRITDFGLARNLDQDSAVTVTGQIMGTPSYMPPEQARGDLAAIGPASDVYSLGVIFYELLAGRPPFKGSSLFDTLALVQNSEPTPPRSHNRAVDRDLDTIVLKCMSKDIGGRYGSAQELADEIDRYLKGEPILARRIGTIARTWRWCRRQPVAAGFIGAMLLVLVSLTVAFTLGRQVLDGHAVTALRKEHTSRLQQPQLDVEWIASFDEPLARMSKLDPKAAEEFRTVVNAAYQARIRSKLREARLSDIDYVSIDAALAGLEERGGGVDTLREQLRQRQSKWQLRWEFAPPWDSLPELTTPLQKTATALVLTAAEAGDTPTTRTVGLPDLPAGNRVRVDVRFDSSWRTGEMIGITLPVRERQQYSFRLRVAEAGTEESPSLKAGQGSTARRSFATAAGDGQPLQLELLRSGVPLQSVLLSAAELTGPLRMRVVRDRDQLSLQVNDRRELNYRDVFPLASGGKVGCRLEWPEAVGVTQFSLWTKPEPETQSPLEQGDRLFDQKEFESALAAYQRQAEETSIDTIRQEALTKAGFCLTRLGRDAMAEEVLSAAFGQPGDVWPALAGCQLWAALLEQNRRTDADGLFAALSSRFRFDRIAPLVPNESRTIILNAYFADRRDLLTQVLHHDPQRIAKLEQATAVDRLLSADGKGDFRNQLKLVHAYLSVDETAQAADTLKSLWSRFPHNCDIARRYTRALRMLGKQAEALDVIEQTSERLSDSRHQRMTLLLERAKVYADQHQWLESERDIDQVLSAARDVERAGSRLYVEPLAWLMKGFLQRRRGQTDAGRTSWRKGFQRCRQVIRKNRIEENVFVAAMILGSLTRELTRDEVMSVVSRSTSEAEGQSLASIISVVISPETIQRVLVEMWWSERGLDLAEQFAYEQLTMVQRQQTLVQLPASTLCRIHGFGGVVSRQQELAVWRAIESLFDGIARTGRIKLPHIAQLGLAWKGRVDALGWTGVAPQLDPPSRATVAWLLGHRSLQLGIRSDAKMYFETVLRDTQDAELRRLTEADLADINNGTGRVELRNDTDQPVTVHLLTDGQSTVVVQVPAREAVTTAVPPANWRVSLAISVEERTLSADTLEVSQGSMASATVNDLWSAGDSKSVLPGVVPLPSDALGIPRWQLTFREPATHSRSIAFSPDGTRIAVGESDGLVRIRDAETANVLQILPGHKTWCTGVSWNRDGTLLASASNDGTVRLWSQPAGRLVGSIAIASAANVTGASFSPTVDEIATVNWEDGLCLWSTDGRLIAKTGRIPGNLFAPAWTSDGQWVAASADQQGLRLIPRTANGFGEPKFIKLATDQFSLMMWNEAGDAFAFADYAKRLHVMRQDGDSWDALEPVSIHKQNVTMVVWDGDDVWTSSYDGHLRKWSTRGKIEQLESEWRRGPNARARSRLGQFAFGDSRTGFSLGRFGSEQNSTGPPTRRIADVARNPSGTRYAAALLPPGDSYGSGEVIVLSADGQPLATVNGRRSAVFLDDNTLLAAGHGNKIVRVRLPQEGDAKATVEETWAELEKPASAIALAPDGRVAAGCVDGNILLFDADGTRTRELLGHRWQVERVGWSAAGWLAASYSYYVGQGGQLWDGDGTAYWPLSQPAESGTGLPADEPQSLQYFSWHPTKNLLAGGVPGQSVRFWSSGEPLGGQISIPYPLALGGLSWSPDGSMLAIIGTRGQLQLFSQAGEVLSNLGKTTGYVRAPVWSPDGSQITMADENGSLRRFRLRPASRANEQPDGPPTIELVPDLTTLLLPDGGAATMTPAGRIVSASPGFEAAVVYIVETDDGRYEMLTATQFNERLGNAVASSP